MSTPGTRTRTLPKLLCHLDRGDDVECGAGAEVEALRVEELVKHSDALGVWYGEGAGHVLDDSRGVVSDTALANTYRIL